MNPSSFPTCRSSRPLVAPRYGRRSAARGFTLLEIVIVIALIGLIVGLAVNRIMANQQRANYKLAESQLSTLAGQVDQYESDVGELPTSLDALVEEPSGVSDWLGPYVTDAKQLKDPWNKPIQLRVPGEDGKPYSVVSLGVDGEPGGDGVDKDIVKP